MKFSEFLLVQEASYSGNIGMMEMFKFYQVATMFQKNEMKEYIEKKLFDKAWSLLQRVTGVKLNAAK
jgi:hypothetical protein